MSKLNVIKQYYDVASKGYDERQQRMPFFRLVDALTLEWLRRCLPMEKGVVVLDAGGGTGKWAIPMGELGYQVIIVDVSKGMLDIANKKIRERKLEQLVQTKQGDIENLDFPDEYFDFVFCEGDTFGLTPHPHKAAKEFFRVLRRGGRASTTFSNSYKLLLHKSMGANDIPWDFLSNRYHIEPTLPNAGGIRFRTFELGEVREMLEDAGMRVVKTAPRIVVTDVLSPASAEKLLVEEKAFNKTLELETHFMGCEDATSLGGHILILTEK